MAGFLGTLLGIALIIYSIYTVFIKPAAAVGKGIQKAVERKQNVGNVEWEKNHRADTMKRFWSANSSPIALAVRLGHMTMLAYSREMSTLPVPDSAGGWDVQVAITNKSAKVIKYITIPFTPYNTVGDRAYSSIGGKSTVNCQFTGPLNPGQTATVVFEKPWYNIQLGWVETETILITFMDGTTYEWHSSLDEYFNAHSPSPKYSPSPAPKIAQSSTQPSAVKKTSSPQDQRNQSSPPVNRSASQTQQKTTSSPSPDKFEAIKKYKELLDMGILTPGEFNMKKAELLGLDKTSPTKAGQNVNNSASVPNTKRFSAKEQEIVDKMKGLDKTDKLEFLSEAVSNDTITTEQYIHIFQELNL